MRRQGLSEEMAEQARLLYESGLSVAAVGERLGQAPTSVARALRRRGNAEAGEAEVTGREANLSSAHLPVSMGGAAEIIRLLRIGLGCSCSS